MDVMIDKAVNLELGKIKEAVKEIKYSDTPETNVLETGTIQPTATKWIVRLENNVN
ncbi:hypothetical protein [Borrelia persica]|uniref:hypothetical protein n=1 Tax=Borrelia persica TaxID=44448 RepID=UPI00190FB759